MQTVFALQPLQNSIFLAGPTPRDEDTPTWRVEALRLFRITGYSGKVFVPESENWKAHGSYDAQVRWEWEALNQSTCVAFWVPRELVRMPAFTTNVEFGYLVTSGKVLLGSPEGAAKMGYLKALADLHGVPHYDSLEGLIRASVDRANAIHAATLVSG